MSHNGQLCNAHNLFIQADTALNASAFIRPLPLGRCRTGSNSHETVNAYAARNTRPDTYVFINLQRVPTT